MKIVISEVDKLEISVDNIVTLVCYFSTFNNDYIKSLTYLFLKSYLK